MALLVLFSTFSFTVEKHFCGEFLVGISYFGNADNCTAEVEEGGCDGPQVVKKKKCCKDEIQQIEGQDTLKNDVEKFDLEQQHFLVAFVASYYQLFTDLEGEKVPHRYYDPPKITKDIQLLHEVFII